MKLDDGDYQRLLACRTGLRHFLQWSEAQAHAAGLSPAHHQLLLAVRGSLDEHGPTIGEISEALLVKHHSAVGLVDRAEHAGLVSRKRDPRDRRVIHVQLTPYGEQVLEELSANHLEQLNRLAPTLRALARESQRTKHVSGPH